MFTEICRFFDREWVARLPADLRARALMEVLDDSVRTLSDPSGAFELLEATWRKAPEEVTDGGHHLLVEQLVLRGRLDDAERVVRERTSVQAEVANAWVLALRGRWSEALEAYERALQRYVKEFGKRHPYFPDRAGIFYVVALLADGKPKSLARAIQLAAAAQRKGVSGHPTAYAVLAEAAEVLSDERDTEYLSYIGCKYWLPKTDPITFLLGLAAAQWIGSEVAAELRAELVKRVEAADAAGYAWLAAQGADTALAAGSADPRGRLSALRARLVGVSLTRAVTRKERWSEALDKLLEIATPARPSPTSDAAEPGHATRLVWVVTENPWGFSVTPREQSRTKNAWSKGRPVALKRLATESAAMDFLTKSDRAACAAIEEHVETRYYGRYRNVSYTIDESAALRALQGAPNVFAEVDGELVPLEIRERQAKIKVERAARGGGFRVCLDPMPTYEGQTTVLVRAGPSTVDIVALGDEHREIAKVLGKKGLDLPATAEARLREVLTALSRFVPSDADLGAGAASPSGAQSPGELVVADASPTFLVRALGEGVSVQAIVRPLGLGGPAFPPGSGGATAFAEIEGKRLRAERDLAEERRRLSAVLTSCPTLASALSSESGYTLRDRDAALSALLELRAAEARLEWPDGGEIEVTDEIALGALAISLRAAGGVLEADGALQVPGSRSLELSTLLGYLDASPGRFLRVGDDRFLALSREMRRRLDELRAVSEQGPKRLQFHPLLLPEVETLLDGARIEADDAWRAQRDRFSASGSEIEVPTTFRGELRPFQQDGFRWLVRLGRWGAGACLADEMGLGKTVQMLALLVSRAPEGPSLVVAPTSVLSSWAEQAARFAPTLRVRIYAGEDRARALANLGAFDLVLTSYALLTTDIDALARVRFVVAAMDEAQAIKNADSQRAQAACRIVAQQRVVITGTPVENRLEDLWSLFRFASPGLLGTRASFDARFVRPIAQDHDQAAHERLRRIVRPFLLRRTKTSVLDELPARTEVTLRVTLAPREMALYEAIREEALRGLEAERGGPSRRMHLLAAITRLRRAACSERLVLPTEQARPSRRRARAAEPEAGARTNAKLEALGDLLDELLPNQHKALVFSQFVDHLALVKELLDARGISYLYLDGSTPRDKRTQAIDAFQAGGADVFLISLKAGGFGLNLTAADYVIHMDPWWNPAVEDQASDRAHRLGQTRPVTIYRIIAKDTIEDRIVALHRDKRELADALLAGAESPARLGEEELLELIRGR
jgi:superfamily II DNA or RNA helicase